MVQEARDRYSQAFGSSTPVMNQNSPISSSTTTHCPTLHTFTASISLSLAHLSRYSHFHSTVTSFSQLHPCFLSFLPCFDTPIPSFSSPRLVSVSHATSYSFKLLHTRSSQPILPHTHPPG
ncbi:hypothetical protein E2C01_043416 [Portunus trituberculatus]|uniref:Uncharacterized protein n=1 Tax=Portunus trituberculatus TaxID=210409 RepID=A0A5B7FXI2_PORTR|nr:hypothetical protein [Portunus trituberculatus]